VLGLEERSGTKIAGKIFPGDGCLNQGVFPSVPVGRGEYLGSARSEHFLYRPRLICASLQLRLPSGRAGPGEHPVGKRIDTADVDALIARCLRENHVWIK